MEKLRDLNIGETGVVTHVGGSGALRQHFLDMGIIPGTEITFVKYAPMGDPMQFTVHGYELTLRVDDAKQITVEPVKSHVEKDGKGKTAEDVIIDHPGLGEGGKFHNKHDKPVLAEGETITFALAGNQNSGKTTLFNQLTGSNQHVGNFPGVTVDRKDGQIRGHENTLVTDLPGIYSMSPYSSEELVTREFILEEKPKAIINIVDAGNIERNLYLTMQLMELDIPMVVALNMMDEVRKNGGTVKINELEKLLGVPVVPISAAKNEGIDELIDHALHVAIYQEKPLIKDLCKEDEDGGAVHRCIHGVMHLIEDHAEGADMPLRFSANKVIEGDQRVIDKMNFSEGEKQIMEDIVNRMEEERNLDRAAAIAAMRFSFILDVCEATVIKPKESREHAISRKADRIMTGKYTAIPVFVGIMSLIFYLTFNVIGAFLQDLLSQGIEWLGKVVAQGLTDLHVNPVIISLVDNGIFKGVGSVLSFLPIIITLFFFLSLLEDSGYMARVAFVMDKLLRRIGLSGRSIVPMLIGFGCSVPGVMASRTLPSERDRKMTILMTPFMSCSAKVPIYGFFTAAFFPNHGAIIMIGLYFLGIILGILMALIFRKTIFKGDAVPFVMELPNYRMPTPKNVALLLRDKSMDFIQKAFSIIFVATIIIWFLQTFNLTLNVVSDSSESMLAAIAGLITPIFKPLGFGDWRISSALITGIMAKESVVSTLNVLFGSTATLVGLFTPKAIGSLLVFCLLYTPCVAAIAAVKRELGKGWTLYVIFGQFAIAWVASFITYGILTLI